ncbi:hypothetical protein C7B62_21290 [Pleurocapsa sp. CCALA 161]|uniref:hypothetical protein n=1 Tax=Pleurocapsa sp. CCALA 161 TaxID=2107688 RepID=UPI000D06E1B9|nr:hypothetical protein [Pleurocapsa sp. CCALA 161]PSB06981.1 hypothetical protein C7B62_21290 [Pleurocapsa sp. CCALA 161]
MARSKKQWRKRRKSASSTSSELAVIPIAPLTVSEESDRNSLERKVERAFYEAGMALMELRDRRLYRSTHNTFEEYCRDRFDYTRRRPYQLIEAAQIYDNLIEKCAKFLHIRASHLGSPQVLDMPVLPTKEGQVQPLSQLERESQPLAWETAVEEAGGKVPTGRIVKNVVRRIKDETSAPVPFRVGEVCQIMAKDNPELRGKSGCWCIVSEVYEFSCLVSTWNSEYLLRPENLKSLRYSTDECKQMENLGVRMTELYETGKLDEAALWVLNGLAKLKTPYLTLLESKLLALLELEYLTNGSDNLNYPPDFEFLQVDR